MENNRNDGTIIPTYPYAKRKCVINSCYIHDFDCDCDVDIVDVTMAAYAFGTSVGDPNYDPAFDLDNDGDIDIVDITMVTYDYGWTCGKSSLNSIDYSKAGNEDVSLSWSRNKRNTGSNLLRSGSSG